MNPEKAIRLIEAAGCRALSGEGDDQVWIDVPAPGTSHLSGTFFQVPCRAHDWAEAVRIARWRELDILENEGAGASVRAAVRARHEREDAE